MDTVCFVKGIKTYPINLATYSARSELRHMEVSGQPTTMAEIGFGGPQAERVISALPAAKHGLAV